MTVRRWFAGTLLTVAACAAAAAGYVHLWLSAPLPVSETRVIDIVPGSALSTVARRLAGEGVLTRPQLFSLYGRWQGAAAAIRAGEYRVEPGTTPRGLLSLLVDGQVVLHSVTLIEGWTFRQVREALAGHSAIRHESEGLDDDAVMQRLGLAGQHPEGRFFPETYRFPRGTADLDVLRQAHEAMQRELDAAWSLRVPNDVVDTPYAALILASIVERETGVDSEREQVAGVFVRRLERGMRLQTDPTVIYGLGERFDGNIRSADLSADTPYNTYTRAGLPPTPISMPGRASLRAAVAPADGSALYFVATGAPDGSHRFSDTLDEHNAAVAAYLKARRTQR